MDIDKTLGISQFVACINYSDLTTTVHIQEMKSSSSDKFCISYLRCIFVSFNSSETKRIENGDFSNDKNEINISLCLSCS